MFIALAVTQFIATELTSYSYKLKISMSTYNKMI